jgi:hypothetical protein
MSRKSTIVFLISFHLISLDCMALPVLQEKHELLSSYV